MPKIKLSFASADLVPSELKAFVTDQNTVEIWAGAQDTVAAELNPGLAQNRDALKTEKDTIQGKYDTLLASSNSMSGELMELRTKVATGSQMSPDDVAIVTAVKSVMPTVKAADLKKELEVLPTLRTENETFKARETNAAIFKASGYKSDSVFLDLIGNKDKNPNVEKFVVETETVDGKPVEKVYAHIKGADGATSKKVLADYVKDNPAWTPYLPALNAGSQQTHNNTWISQDASGGNQGGGSGNADGKSILDKFIEDKNKAAAGPSPFARNQSAPTGTNQNVPQN